MRIRNVQTREGAYTVEFAMVCVVVLLLLFGILEWCRYLMVRQVSENALREGARFAVARTDVFQTGVSDTDIRTQVTNYLAQAGTQLTNIQITIYKCNQAGQPLDVNGAIVGSPAAAGRFDQTTFGEYIAVTMTAEYSPVVPSFLSLAPNISVQVTSIMCSEGN